MSDKKITWKLARINSDGTVSKLVGIPKKMLELEAKGFTPPSLAKLREKYTEEKYIDLKYLFDFGNDEETPSGQ